MFTVQIIAALVAGLYVYAFLQARKVHKAIERTNERMKIAKRLADSVHHKLESVMDD